jgi:tetratricopeptide (TPR) repeat protein
MALEQPEVRRRVLVLAGLSIAVAVLASYGNSLSGPFVFDDVGSILGNPSIRPPLSVHAVFSPPQNETVSGRPVLNLSLALNYAAGGASVEGYHAVNLAIHILAAWVLFGVVRRTLRRLDTTPEASALTGWGAALLWSVHPLQTESVTYIIQRAESLMALLYLSVLYAFIRATEPNVSRASARAWLSFGVAACLFGMGTKETMASAPLIVLVYDATFASAGFRSALRLRRSYYAALAATWLPLAALISQSRGRAGTVGFGAGVPWSRYALTQGEAVLHYLRLAIWPNPLVFDYGGVLAANSAAALASAALVLAVVFAAALAVLRRSPWGFLGAAFFGILAPSSSVIPIATETIAEHRMYLPLAAVLTGVVLALHRLLGTRAIAVVLLLAAVSGWATARRNVVFQSEGALWGDTVRSLPTNPFAHYNLALALAKAGDRSAAEEQDRVALAIKPNLARARVNLGVLRELDGYGDEALADYRGALDIEPNSWEGLYDLARLLEGRGEIAESERYYRDALRVRPESRETRVGLARALERRALAGASSGRPEEALREYREALGMNPDSEELEFNLANLLAQQGSQLEAITHLEAALRLRPDFPEAELNLANALLAVGRGPEAIRHYEACLKLRPGYADARYNLELALRAPKGTVP